MQEILGHMSPTELGAILALAGLVAGGLIVTVARSATGLLSRAGTVRIGSVQLGSQNKEPCINSVKFLLVLAKQAEYINLRRDIKHSILPDQMRYAESISGDIRGLLLKTYTEAMRIECMAYACDNSVIETPDYHLYRLSLRILHEEMRDWVRECFRENHFHERSEDDFERYVKAKIPDGLQIAAETLDDLYRGKVMARDKVRAANTAIASDLYHRIESIFREARRISLAAEDAIQKAEAEYNAYAEEQMQGTKE